jgi:hypothetical protein
MEGRSLYRLLVGGVVALTVGACAPDGGGTVPAHRQPVSVPSEGEPDPLWDGMNRANDRSEMGDDVSRFLLQQAEEQRQNSQNP